MQIQDYLTKYRKRILFNYNKISLEFDSCPELFSSASIDKGTFQLIDSLRKNQEINYTKVLDLACGYGPIGIFIKKFHKEAEVQCTDRDSIALDFTKHNAALNNCEINVYPSLDFENIKDKFNLICCNYPAKAGKRALKKFICDSSNFLDERGILAIVIVKELEKDLLDILNGEIIIKHKQLSSGHLVYHLQFKKPIQVEREDVYLRSKINFSIENKNYEMKTAFNLPEFENPSFSTQAAINLLKETKNTQKIILLDPLQGHLALAIEHYLNPKELLLISRDLLSLKYSEENLRSKKFDNFKVLHKAFIEEELGDLLIWRFQEIEFERFKKQLEKAKKNFKEVLISTKKSFLNKAIKQLDLNVKAREELNGFKAILI